MKVTIEVPNPENWLRVRKSQGPEPSLTQDEQDEADMTTCSILAQVRSQLEKDA